jgi:hypothetical protein
VEHPFARRMRRRGESKKGFRVGCIAGFLKVRGRGFGRKCGMRSMFAQEVAVKKK